jgi:hypothetical protein
MINLSRVRKGMGCADCGGSCRTGIGRINRHGVGFLSMAGLGDTTTCDSDGNCAVTDDNGDLISYTPAPVDVTAGAVPDCVFGGTYPNCNAGSAGSITSTTSSSASTAANNATVAALVNQAGSAVSRLTQQSPYFITSPNGQSVLFNPNTGTISGAAAIGTATLGSLLPLFILAGGAFLLIEVMEKH